VLGAAIAAGVAGLLAGRFSRRDRE
jgi:hypothetical protein